MSSSAIEIPRTSVLASSNVRIPRIDSIRAICAFWVFFAHLGPIPLDFLSSAIGPQAASLLRSLLGFLFNGVAAVVCFFVISGLCIHLPLKDQPLRVGSYLARRFIRVGLPVVVAASVGHFVFGNTDFLTAVLWSVYCELFYYALYPVLRTLANRFGWTPLLIISSVAALLLAAIPDENRGAFWTYGIAWTWLLGLPIWLSGVWIAEQVKLDAKPPRLVTVQAIRAGLWFFSATALVLHFHSPLHYKFSMLLFAIPAAAWLVVEMRAGHINGTSALLEWAGAWSFSLYLCHKAAIEAQERGWLNLESLSYSSSMKWLITLCLGTGLALAFYKVVEFPCHQLARTAARKCPPLLVVP